MSQQYTQQPQTGQAQAYQGQGYQAQTRAGQQFQQAPVAQMVGQQFQQSVPREIQNAVLDLDRLETVSEWLQGRATEHGRPRIAQRAEDFAEIAHLQKNLLLRGSPFADPIGQATKQTLQSGIQELQQYAGEPEVQETLTHAQQTLSTVEQAIAQFQQFGGQAGATQQ